MDRSFGQLRYAVAPFVDFGRAWFVAGGWAFDLFVGKVTRSHQDIDVALVRDDQDALF